MARPSNLTTPMARKRVGMKLTQPEFAKLLGVSCSSVQAIELGHLKMSPRMELRMAALDSKDVLALIEQKVAAYRAELMKAAGIKEAPKD